MSTFDEIEALEHCAIGQEVLWSSIGLGMNAAAFDALYGRLEVLEAAGRIRITDHGHESAMGQRFFTRVRFQRLQ
jgi:hypothetical protein